MEKEGDLNQCKGTSQSRSKAADRRISNKQKELGKGS